MRARARAKSNKRTGKELLTELETSLKNLRTDRIDVYQLHNVSSKKSWEQIKGPGGALNAVYRALDEGKIEHLGVTSHDPDFLTDIIEEDIFETAMIPFNYLTPIPQKRLLPLCRKTNVGTVIMKPLGGGAFSNIETALKFVLGSENVDVVIPGMMTSREVEENIKIANGPFTLLERDNSLIERDKRELGNEFCRACNYCQPCLQDVPISFVLRAESQFLKRMGWRPGTEERINNAIEKAKGCIECGECEERCPYKLPIRELLKEKTSSLISLLEERTG